MARLKPGIMTLREQIISRALSDEDISDQAFRVLTAMVGHINGEEFTATGRAICWPSADMLAAQIRRNRATVLRARAELIEHRVIDATNRKGGRGRRGSTEFLTTWLAGQGELPLIADQKPAAEISGETVATLRPFNGHVKSRKIVHKESQICIPSIDDSDDYQDEKKERSARALRSGARRGAKPNAKLNGHGSRLPDSWSLTDEWRTAATDARSKFKLPPVDLDLQAALFANHWHGKTGQHATKKDWRATWINWALKSEPPRASVAGRPRLTEADIDDVLSKIPAKGRPI